MGLTESSIRYLPDKRGEKIFNRFFQSPNFAFLSTVQCSEEMFNGVVRELQENGLDWISPVSTGTSREIFSTKPGIDPDMPRLVLKKSKHKNNAVSPMPFTSQSPASEIRNNIKLNSMVDEMLKSGKIGVPNSFSKVLVKLEEPVGIIIDREKKDKYSVFKFEQGYDSGEILQYIDPPIEGGNYTSEGWRIYCGIADILTQIKEDAAAHNLELQDYHVHQVLYRTDASTQQLELVLLDSERFYIAGN